MINCESLVIIIMILKTCLFSSVYAYMYVCVFVRWEEGEECEVSKVEIQLTVVGTLPGLV